MGMTIDTTGFARGMRAQSAYFQKSAKEILTKQGRLLVRDLIKLTPPFDNKHSISTSLNVHRRIGDFVVARDIGRVFRPLSGLGVWKNPTNKNLSDQIKYHAKGLRPPRSGRPARIKNGRYVPTRATRSQEALKKLLARAGIHREVVWNATREVHQAARGRRGRVHQDNWFKYVVNEKSIKRYVKQRQRSVGFAKAGWRAGAKALGFHLPPWIKRHFTNGYFRDDISHPISPWIEIGNRVAFRRDFEIGRIVQAALQNRRRSMRTEMRKAQAGMARAHRAAV